MSLSGMTFHCSFYWARNAIFHCLKALNIQPEEEILVPSFICSAAVEPIAAYGAKPVFYGVTRGCRPSLEDVEARIGSYTRAILTVHYFGFPQDLRQMRAVCDRYGLYLIEDCAHILPNGSCVPRVGAEGDACVFSWRKLLPVNDGAALYLKVLPQGWEPTPGRESLRLTLKVAKGLLDQLAEQSSFKAVRIPYRWLEHAKKLLLPALGHAGTTFPGDVLDGNLPGFDLGSVNLPMTRLSGFILSHSTNSQIVEKRRRNYSLMADQLSQISGITPLFSSLAAGVCPWVFPVFFDGVSHAHVALRQKGIPATSWGGVRSASLVRSAFPDSDYLYENLVFLPVHQSLDEAELAKIVAAVKAVRASLTTQKAEEAYHRR